MSEANKALLRRYYEEVVSGGLLDELPRCLAADYAEVHGGRRHPIGLEGARQHILGVRRTYPDLRLEVQQQIAEGEWVASTVRMRGTHLGEWLGMRPTGLPVEATAVNVDRVVAGRIVEHGGAADLLGPLLEIGAVEAAGGPPPAAADLGDGVSVRPFRGAADAEACAGLMAASEPWRTLGRSREDLLASLRAPGPERYLAERGGACAGLLVLNLRGAFVGYLQTVAVAAPFRGRGLGTALVAFAEARIFRDHPNVFLCVSSFNPGAQRLYRRLGYREVGELPDYLVRGHGEILMRKSRGPLFGAG